MFIPLTHLASPIEKLDFTAPGLSRRLNRILARSGRKAVRDKLKDFEERHGITFSEVNPACSSQTCSTVACGHVEKTSRKPGALRLPLLRPQDPCRRERGAQSGGRTFRLRSDRVPHLRADSLRLTVSRHLERLKARGRVTSADPHGKNRYFSGFLPTAGSDALPNRKPPELVADVSAG